MSFESFQQLEAQVYSLYGKEKYREALEAVLKAAERFPEREARITFWKACLQTRLSDYEGALRVLRQALEKGIWFPDDMLLRDPDLRPLHDRNEFKAILATCERLKREAKAKPDLLVLTPTVYAHSKNYGLVFAMHQRYGEHPSEFSRHWQGALSAGMILAVPWSSQAYGVDGRCWDNPEQAERDVIQAYLKTVEDYGIELSKVVLAGFSQGAALAIYLALKRSIPCRGFIAVASSDWISPERKTASEREHLSETFVEFIRSGDGQGLKGWMLTGEKDPFLTKVRTLREELVKIGVECQLVVEPSLGHSFPDDFETKMRLALSFVLG